MDPLCACGKPLHYARPDIKEAVEHLIREAGNEFIIVHRGQKSYLVQRHYIALHGLKSTRLAKLAEQGIITEIHKE